DRSRLLVELHPHGTLLHPHAVFPFAPLECRVGALPKRLARHSADDLARAAPGPPCRCALGAALEPILARRDSTGFGNLDEPAHVGPALLLNGVRARLCRRPRLVLSTRLLRACSGNDQPPWHPLQPA